MSHLTNGIPIDSPIHTANRLFDTDGLELAERRAIAALLTDTEIADLERTVGEHGIEDWERAVEDHPYASSSLKARFRIALWLWNGYIPLSVIDIRRQDITNRARVVHAFRIIAGEL